MKRILLIALTLFSLTAGVFALAAPDTALAAAKDDICAGVGAATGSGCAGGEAKISSTIKSVVNLLSTIVGIVAVIMIIVGGFKYITSQGDSGSISSAKNTLIYAVIGLIVVAMAQFIVRFVLNKVGV